MKHAAPRQNHITCYVQGGTWIAEFAQYPALAGQLRYAFGTTALPLPLSGFATRSQVESHIRAQFPDCHRVTVRQN